MSDDLYIESFFKNEITLLKPAFEKKAEPILSPESTEIIHKIYFFFRILKEEIHQKFPRDLTLQRILMKLEELLLSHDPLAGSLLEELEEFLDLYLKRTK
jgi:hypothetical protein